MKIIISPAKKMRVDSDMLDTSRIPVLVEKADKLRAYLKELSLGELKTILGCNDRLAALNHARFVDMDLYRPTTSAILAYDGVQYQYMAPQVFEERYFEYVDRHVRILSGLYGILRPLDGIVPYRLEMKTRLRTSFCKNLYDYWKDSIYQELVREDDLILNLASKEYSRTVEKYLKPDIRYISCTFGEREGDSYREKGVYVKMARGEMVRFMAENDIRRPEEIKAFDRLGFAFSEQLSGENKYIFLRAGNGGMEHGER